ncbi:MAG: hypothetical protein WD826_02615, partial [Actinomycetota bacterium]
MTDARRAILERVAKGEITPADAEAALRDLESAPGGSHEGRWTPPPAGAGPAADPPRTARPAAAPSGSIRRIKVRADFGALVIEGDPTVAEAEIDGPHTATVEGDTLVIRGQRWTDLDPEITRSGAGVFAINVGRGGRGHRIKRGRLNFGEFFGNGVQLRIRINPTLALESTLDAGPMSISGVTGPIRARSAAGPITIEGFESPLDAAVNAGAIRAVGRLTSGESKVSSDAGAVRVVLDPASSVHILAEAALGRVMIPGIDPDRGRKF